MLKNDKEIEIKNIIKEITGINKEFKNYRDDNTKISIRSFRIKKILLISSLYNYFLLEEEGRLKNLISEWYSYDLDNIKPIIKHVETTKESLEIIEKEEFDLIIIFNKPQDSNIISTSEQIKDKIKTPVALLGNHIKELERIANLQTKIDKIFTWNGDGKIILSIIQYFEDLINIKNEEEYQKIILLIEDSIQHYSTYFSILTDEIFRYSKSIIHKNLSNEQKNLRFKRRPFIIHTVSFEKYQEIFEKYKEKIIFIISDNYKYEEGKRTPIGIEIAKKFVKEKPDLQILIQSSEPFNYNQNYNKNITYILKKSPATINKIRTFIRKNIGPLELIIKDPKSKENIKIKTIKDLESALINLDRNEIYKVAKKCNFSKWSRNICVYELAEKFEDLEKNCTDKELLKNKMIDFIEDYNYSLNQTSISSFSIKEINSLAKISRIGRGSLGGKARGIAFVAKILSKYITEDMFDDLKITVPRSIVLSTDVFEIFLEHNKISDLDFNHLSDDRIASNFMEADIPATVLGDLRSFIRNTRKPLIIRSSGLLEDSLMQPFAGIYSSVILPNESWETDLRFQEVCNAIKFVYSSTYFEKARTYIQSTPKNIGDEKMAILIQEVIGNRHGNYFYPTISGVAKSFNYYPSGPCNQEQGIAYLALGLGKSIVDGGSSFAFCPEKPKAPLFGTQKEYMKYAQSKFYALNLRSIYRFVDFNEDTSLNKLDIDIAKKHSVLEKLVSTYIGQDDKFYPGIYEDGYLVLDFAPILNYEEIPLAKAIKLLLKISEIALGYPVEIEFAVNLPQNKSEKAELIILQIRNMIPPSKKIDIDIEKIQRKESIFYSENALGNGIFENLNDIVYVNQDSFDLSNSVNVVNQIKKFNLKLMDEKKPYILIGPGRWGSSDPWLGIPVIWSDIAGAKIIVETPYKERHIDPSQGSHFFHDMIASEVGYLITKKQNDIKWEWIEKQKIIEETEFIKHIKTDNSLQAIIDGKKGKAIVRKK